MLQNGYKYIANRYFTSVDGYPYSYPITYVVSLFNNLTASSRKASLAHWDIDAGAIWS